MYRLWCCMNLLLCEWQASQNTCPVHISLSLACVSLMTYLHCTALCLQTCVPAVAEAKPCSTVCVKLGDQQSWAQACCQSAGSKPPLWSVGGRFVEGRNFLCWVRTTPLEGRTTFCGGSEPSLLGRNRPCGRSEHVLWRVGTSPHLAYILLRGRWCGVDYASRRKGFMYLINIL